MIIVMYISLRVFVHATLRDENLLISFPCLDCQEALFNPNCMTKVLLEDIKKRCRLDREGLFVDPIPCSLN